ncbi:cation:proton antiporter [Dactylosporangium sp. NBC_01737]|uniref:cation:proton antiporter n=1 Tax=Dactylosporangium sp. NBC_01737 TaxID=2975959 RepID=UPI002E1429B3|nr:cation:proton antiporter [Dactylosporangium sp. NBC_01737]
MGTVLASDPMPPVAAATLLVFLVQVATLLAAAILLGRLAARLGMAAIVGELFAGVLLGPSLLGHVAPATAEWLFPHRTGQFNMLDAVGQLGMLLLVGVAGMCLDVGLLRRQGPRAGVVSLTSLIIPLVLGVVCGLLLPAVIMPASGDRAVFAGFIGVALCVSAIPVIAKILADLRLLHRDLGQLTLMAAGVDDAIGWLLLAVVTTMATVGVSTGSVLLSVLTLTGILLFTGLVLRPLLHVVLRFTDRAKDQATTVAVIAVLIVACSAATQALKMEAVLGAFLCGIAISSTRRVDAARLSSLRTVVLGVLAPIFFATAGLRMDLTLLADPTVALSAVVVLAVAVIGKFGGAYLGAGIIGLDRWHALSLGAGLNARGVVQIVVASVGLRVGVIGTTAYTIIVLVALATSVMAPPMLRYALRRVETTPAEHDREVRLGLAREEPPVAVPVGSSA